MLLTFTSHFPMYQSTFLSNKLNFEKKLTGRPSPSVQCISVGGIVNHCKSVLDLLHCTWSCNWMQTVQCDYSGKWDTPKTCYNCIEDICCAMKATFAFLLVLWWSCLFSLWFIFGLAYIYFWIFCWYVCILVYLLVLFWQPHILLRINYLRYITLMSINPSLHSQSSKVSFKYCRFPILKSPKPYCHTWLCYTQYRIKFKIGNRL